MTLLPPAPLVLIVDDNEKNLKLAREVLRAAGIRTLEAARGADAIRLATEHSPDVVLLDLRLPDMDGGEVARELASRKRTQRIPVVALSALRRVADDEELRAAGFAGHLEKPINVGSFSEQVLSYLA
jgi:two-component system, cell cycle response regulator DivK